MSEAKEDWKYFEQVSDIMCIKDLTSPKNIEVNGMSKGRWAVFCVYDDINRIERVVMATEDVMEKLMPNKGARSFKGDYIGYDDFAYANAGLFCFFDKAHMNEYQKGYESKFTEDLIARYGQPDDESKSNERQFIELAMHLTRFSDLDLLDTAHFGAFFRAHSDLNLGFVRDKKDGKVKLIEAVAKHVSSK